MIRTSLFSTLAVLTLATSAGAKPFAEMFPQFADAQPSEAVTIVQSLDYQQGKIALPGGFAELDVPQGYYYLGPADAKKVLTDLWGNPPDDSSLGMIFPADVTPAHDTWGVDIKWDPQGYVSDADADTINYDDLLAEMKSGIEAENETRKQDNYPPISLIGWAEPPRYDKLQRKLHWAKELKFGDEAQNTLNYNIRVLGRKGVLVMNFIAGMEQLPQVKAALPAVLGLASFTDGNRYEQFNPDIDTVAAVGLGGLITGTVLSKTGALAAILLLVKKFWFFALIPLAALWKLVSRRRA